jgi:hypothetical protein
MRHSQLLATAVSASVLAVAGCLGGAEARLLPDCDAKMEKIDIMENPEDMYALMQSCIERLKTESPPRQDEQYHLTSSIALDIMKRHSEGIWEAGLALVASVLNAGGDEGKYQAFPYLYKSINRFKGIRSGQLSSSGIYSVYYDAMRARRRAGCFVSEEDLKDADYSVKDEFARMPIDSYVDMATRSGICVEGSLLMTAVDVADGVNESRGCERIIPHVKKLRNISYQSIAGIRYEYFAEKCKIQPRGNSGRVIVVSAEDLKVRSAMILARAQVICSAFRENITNKDLSRNWTEELASLSAENGGLRDQDGYPSTKSFDDATTAAVSLLGGDCEWSADRIGKARQVIAPYLTLN